MMISTVWICMPHAKIIMQMLKPDTHREVVDDVTAEDAKKVKSAEGDVINQTPKP